MSNFSRGLQKVLSKPVRITPTIRPGNPVMGLEGLTGAPAMEIFGRPLAEFGTRPKKALVGLTRVRGKK